MKRISFVFAFVLLFLHHTNAQNVDSLKRALTIAKEDTNKIEILGTLYFYYKTAYPDTALPSLQEAYQLSKNLKFDVGIRISLSELSDLYQRLNNYKQSLNYDSMKFSEF